MFDSVRPHRRESTRLCHPWDSPGKNTGVGCHFLLQCMKVKRESEVTQSCLTLCGLHGLQPTRLLHPWDFPGKSTGVGCHCLLHGFSGTAQIIAPIRDSSFSEGPIIFMSPPGPPWSLHLSLPDPGSNIPQEEVEQTVYPQGELSHRKKRAVIAPLLTGTGIAAALGARTGGISTSAHFCYKLSQELNEDV